MKKEDCPVCNWRTRPPVLTCKEAAELIRTVQRDVIDAYTDALQGNTKSAASLLNHAMHMAVDALIQRQDLADTVAAYRLNSEQLKRDYQDIEMDLAALRNAVRALFAAEDMPPHTPFDGNSAEWDEKFDAEHFARKRLRELMSDEAE